MPDSSTITNLFRRDMVNLVDDLRRDLVVNEFGLRTYDDVKTVTRTWDGGEKGLGAFVDVDHVIDPVPKVLPMPPRVIASSGGTFETGDRKVNAADMARVLAGWGSGQTPEQGNFDLVSTTGSKDLITLFGVGSGPLADFTAPAAVGAPDAVTETPAVSRTSAAADATFAQIDEVVTAPQFTTDSDTRRSSHRRTRSGPQRIRRVDVAAAPSAPTSNRRARLQAVDAAHESNEPLHDELLVRRRR